MIKKTCCALFCLLTFFILPSNSLELSKLNVDSVEFYPSGAMVKFLLSDNQSAQLILPGTFKKDSIRYETDSDTTVTSFNVKEKTVSEWYPDTLASLRKEIDNLLEEKRELLSITKGLEQTVKHLDNWPLDEVETSEIKTVLNIVQKERTKTESELTVKKKELELTTKKISLLENQYNSMTPPFNNRFLIISLTWDGPGDALISAWTDHAHWNPEYDMKLDTRSESIELALKAKVSQKTGIDLGGNLVFNTAIPQRSLTHPEIEPQIVDFRDDASTFKMLRENVSRAMFKDEAQVQNRISQSITNLSLSSSGVIPGTGEKVSIALVEEYIDVNVSSIMIPALSEEAWITAETPNLTIPLLEGPAKMFVDGSPGGETVIRGYAVGEKFEMPFGKIPLLKAKRKEFIDRESTSWTGKGRLVKGYTINAVNGLKSKRYVTFMDRVPVSSNEDIEVEILEITPEVSQKDEKNILKWQREMLPGETLEIKVKYVIKYPGGKEIQIR